MAWLPYILYPLLLILELVGLFINVLNLPGLVVMAVGILAYWAATRSQFIGWKMTLALVVLAIAGELFDTFAAGAGAKRAGSSKKGMLGALVGGIVGGIVFQGLIPIPIVGAIFGVMLGCFLGAGLVEILSGKKVAHSARIGANAAGGKLIGILTKLFLGVVIFLVTCVSAFPSGRHVTATAASPTTAPFVTTLPTTHP